MERAQNILLVDDDLDLREAFGDFLTDEGYVVQTSGNGLEALEILERFPADLMLTDLNMPDMDGIELIQRARGVVEGLPAVLLTAQRRDNPQTVISAAGAAAYMVKPVALGDLLAVVQLILGAPRVDFLSAQGAPSR